MQTTQERWDRDQARRNQAGGLGATTPAAVVRDEALARLSDYVAAAVKPAPHARGGWERDYGES
jgi:hypothetical protein